MSQTMKALRIQMLKPSAVFAVPWYSVGIALLIVVGLFAVIHGESAPYSGRTTGALSAFYLSGIGVQPWLVTQLFPFTSALSVTRRAFVQATALLVLAETVVAGLGLAVLNKLEIASHGWFVKTRMFNLPFVHQDNFFTQALVYGVPMLTITSITAFLGAVFRTFGQIGLWLFFVGTSFAAAVVVAVLALTHSLGHFAHFFGAQPMLADFALYPLVLVVVFGSGWAVLMLRARV
ncbi:hypothetical protein ABH920_009992 [Catenulispora sp. EB89]|uniref:hypothetical protein n=1 Tax=Catenulispora sp. EB89 TaxID=3156257 RepID=UPI003513BE2F